MPHSTLAACLVMTVFLGASPLAACSSDPESTGSSSESISCAAVGVHSDLNCGQPNPPPHPIVPPLTPPGCFYDSACSTKPLGWTTDDAPFVAYQADGGASRGFHPEYYAYMQAHNCTTPEWYTPGTTGSGFPWPISFCPTGVVQPGDPVFIVTTCDQCTGAIPAGQQLITWDPSNNNPGGCHRPGCNAN